MVTDDPVAKDPIFVKEPIYFNIFECRKNILNKLDATCERVCMATPRDKYSTESLRTITDCNDRNCAPLFNEKIKYAIHRVIVEEEKYSHNLTVDNSIQTPVMTNTQRENEKLS